MLKKEGQYNPLLNESMRFVLQIGGLSIIILGIIVVIYVSGNYLISLLEPVLLFYIPTSYADLITNPYAIGIEVWAIYGIIRMITGHGRYLE